jgi:hypothetical protein
MSRTFKPGDRVLLCQVVESVQGDTVNIVTWDGLHAPVWSRFLQPAPAPNPEPQPDMLTAEGMWRLINHLRIP